MKLYFASDEWCDCDHTVGVGLESCVCVSMFEIALVSWASFVGFAVWALLACPRSGVQLMVVGSRFAADSHMGGQCPAGETNAPMFIGRGLF